MQGIGKVPFDVEAMNVDLASVTAHKMYGPKGVGALYVRRSKPRVRITAQMDGGGHEFGMRSGTLNVPGIVGFGKAAEIMTRGGRRGGASASSRCASGCAAGSGRELDSLQLNGSLEHRLPGNLNVSFAFVEGEAMMMAIKDVAVSSGSACTSASLEPSYVLHAMGVGDDLAHSSIRFGLGRFNTEEEVDYVADLVIRKVEKLREMSPLYEMHKEGIDLASRAVGGSLKRTQDRESGPWHTARKSSSTTRTRATSGRSTRTTSSVGTGLVGAPACGDVMRLQIKVGDDGLIEDAKFKTFGCGSAIASSSLATEWLKGKTVDEAATIKNSMIAEELHLPPVKIHCSVLAEDAIKSAIADFRAKQAARRALGGGGACAASARAPSDGGSRGAASHDEHAERARRGAGLQAGRASSTPASRRRRSRVSPPRSRPSARQLDKRGTPDAAIRIGIRGGGCSGFSYVDRVRRRAPRAGDLVLEFAEEGKATVRVFCDKKSIIYLGGSVLDWEKTLMFQGFKFKNPQEATRCGCGHSFTVAD